MAPTNSEVLSTISTYCSTHRIPLFYIHSVGFYSQFSISLPPAFPIVDTHPDPTATTDLRLLKPWPDLEDFVQEKTNNLASLSEHDLGHVPYVLLLLHFIQEWKSNHDGLPPTSYKDKTDFREMVRNAAPSLDEENFGEAAAAVLKSLNPAKPSSSVLETINAPEARIENLTASSESFWFIANAIHQFYLQHDELPLPGAVPDMKAKSADYIRLQNIYKTRARQDVHEVFTTVRDLEKGVGRSPNHAVTTTEVEAFCKGAAHVKLVRGRPILAPQPDLDKMHESRRISNEAAAMGLMMPAESGILIVIAFQAWDVFTNSHTDGNLTEHKVPGLKTENIIKDEEELVGIAHRILDEVIKYTGTAVEEPDLLQLREDVANLAKELVRAGGSELHNIASLTGGMVAQEVIKVITKQYVPVDNTCVFDGVLSKAAVLRL